MTKNGSEAVVNVNLRRCDCGAGERHAPNCPGEPVLLRLPLESWRSVTLMVRLGECTAGCAAPGAARALKERGESHHAWCPARPIRVSCSISGKDWASSEVAEVEVEPRSDGYPWRQIDIDTMSQIARWRWALVTVLVLGFDVREPSAPMVPTQLSSQRDAVYTALCEMARADIVACETRERINALLQRPAPSPFRQILREPEAQAPDALAAYVERLIGQVGALS